MNLSIRFPNISAYFEGMNKSFTVFGFEITVYGILVAVGMLLGLAVIMLQVRKHKENPNLYLGMVLISLIGGVIGARLYYLAFSWEAFSGKPWTELINIRGGGLAIYGGIFGGALAGFIYCKIRKVSFGQMADTVSIGLLTGQIIGVWGNAFNREAFGEYTDSLFAMQIPLESVHSSAVTKQMRDNLVMVLDEPFIQVHPLFLYESIWCFVGLFLLVRYIKKRRFAGDIALRYLVWYGAGRFWIEALRTDSLLLVPSIGLRVSQLVAGIAVVGGVIAEILLTRKFRDKPLMVELPLNSENRARMKKLDGPTTFAGTDAALPASASRAEFVEKTAAWNETVKKALDRREHPEKNEKNPE